MTGPPPRSHPALRPLFFVLGLMLTAIGVFGVMTPGWPGTIFLIFAAGCFARSSPRLEAWLVNHPRFGPAVRGWRENGAIPRRAKIVAIASMIASFGIVLLVRMEPLWTWIIGALLLASAVFVATRPEGPKPAR